MMWKNCMAGRDCSNVPSSPGCYAIFITKSGSHKRELVYIGTTWNLRYRLGSHEIIKILTSVTNYRIDAACKIIFDKAKRIETEEKLIYKLSPKINSVGKNNG
jgi:excinuclease UvrABC nuclease subunit